LNDGRLIGSFNFFLRSPVISTGFTEWVDVESAQSTISTRVRQIIILIIGIAWKTHYEIYAHAAIGKAADLDDSIIGSLKSGRHLLRLNSQELAANRFTSQLSSQHCIDNQTYLQAIESLKEQGVADMVRLIGTYLATSAFSNALEVPDPRQ